jgi:hypothetical protein
MLPLFSRATKSALALLGEGSFLRGVESCKVNIEHGVQLAGTDDNMVVDKDVATIDSDMNPKVGDSLSHPDGNFILDVLLEDRGAFKRFIVLKV